MTSRTVRIATRTSALALWQAEHIAACLRRLPGSPLVELVHVVTAGDTNQTNPLRQFGGTGAFTREVQHAVLEGRADLAVHSLKDLPTDVAEGLALACVPERAPRLDALLFPSGVTPPAALEELPDDARIGTGSVRRQAQLRHLNRRWHLLEIRGNVDTRLRKLDQGEYDVIVLAEAGLRRLGLHDRISLLLRPPSFLPAVGQGALGLECRSDDDDTRALLQPLSDDQATAEVTAERSLLRQLRAGCYAPVGAWCQVDGSLLTLTAVLLSADGHIRLEETGVSELHDAGKLGIAVADRLYAAGGDQLLRPVGIE